MSDRDGSWTATIVEVFNDVNILTVTIYWFVADCYNFKMIKRKKNEIKIADFQISMKMSKRQLKGRVAEPLQNLNKKIKPCYLLYYIWFSCCTFNPPVAIIAEYNV